MGMGKENRLLVPASPCQHLFPLPILVKNSAHHSSSLSSCQLVKRVLTPSAHSTTLRTGSLRIYSFEGACPEPVEG